MPLPATREEGERVASWWARSKQRRLPVRRLTGEEATEPAVTEAMSQARVLHLATHGYFTDRSCNSALEDEEQAPDPMTLSGLALAAVNRPSEAQQVHDGLLTAADVARLDLGRVGLVVLSACETGLGATRSGQGVLGLRRAFSAAGADALVVSLWSVPDQATRSLMDDFYRFHLRRGVTPPEALRRAQLAQLHEQQRTGTGHPSGWAGFVVVGRSSP